MSAYGIGADTATVDGEGRRVNTAATNAPATIVKWIPGEVITFYAAILGLGATQGPLTGDETAEQLLERIDAGSPGWFLFGLGVSCTLVLIGSVTAPRADDEKLAARAVVVR